MSLPSRECGLKSFSVDEITKAFDVTPLAGVWIEILSFKMHYPPFNVTPLAGVWIEIPVNGFIFYLLLSLPSRECGLK